VCGGGRSRLVRFATPLSAKALGGKRLRSVEQMPTVLRDGPYRLFFYAGDREEPPHIHVEREAKIAKIRFEPIRLQRSGGFNRAEIGRI